MHYFLVAAVIGFFGYLLIGHLERHELLDQPRYKLGGITVDLSRGATLWIARALTILLVAIIAICVMYLHTRFVGPAMSDQRWPVITGLTFGLLAAIWTRSVLANPAHTPLSSRQLLAIAALAVLFLAGGLSDVFNRYIDRLQQVSLPGGISIVFAITDLAPAKSTYSSAEEPLPLFGSDYTAAKGLEYLGALDAMIQQDCFYVEKSRGPPGTHLASPGCDSADPRVQELKPIRAFFRVGLSSHARCVADVYGQFGDKEFWRSQILPIAPILRIVEDRRLRNGNQAYPPASLSEAFTSSLAETSMRLISALAAPGATTLHRVAEHVLSSAQSGDIQIPKNCANLLLVACGPDAEVERWISGGRSDWMNANLSSARTCIADVNRGMNDDAHGPSFDVIKQRYSDRLKRYSDAVFANIDAEVSNRPYMTIAHVLVASQLQATAVGLQSLNTWIAAFETRSADASSKWRDNPWLSIGARNLLFVFAEYGIDQNRATPLFLDAHLRNWETQLQMEYNTGLRDYLDVLRNPKHNAEDAADTLYDDSGCEFDQRESPGVARLARSIVVAAAHNTLAYVERALTSASDDDSRSAQINSYLQQLATANLACTETEEGGAKEYGAGPRTIRAAALYWIAQRQTRAVQRELTAPRDVSRDAIAANKSEAKKRLRAARALAERGLILVDEVSEADEKASENNYLKMHRATDAMRTSARLKKLLKDIDTSQGQLSN